MLVIFAALSTGCAKDYIVVHLNVSDQLFGTGAGGAEISSTNTYRDKLDDIKVVAIRLPEYCVTESAGEATGRSTRTDVTMQTTCGVSLSELERSLVNNGYRVISWDTVHRLERSDGLSTYRAASQLGIDAVLIINSLGSDAIRIGDLSMLTLSYHHSNPEGEVLAPAQLSRSTRQAIRQMLVDNRYKSRGNEMNMLSATLDINVVLVETGDAIWYYRRTVNKNLVDEDSRMFLLRGQGIHYRPVRPIWMVESADLGAERSIDIYQQDSPQHADTYRAMRHELERSVCVDFVESFRSGIRRN